MYFIEEKLSTVSWFHILSAVNRKYEFLIPLAEKKGQEKCKAHEAKLVMEVFHWFSWLWMSKCWSNGRLKFEPLYLKIDFYRIYDLFRPAVVSIKYNEWIHKLVGSLIYL